MPQPRRARVSRLLTPAAAVLLLAACGGSDGDDVLGIGGDLDDRDPATETVAVEPEPEPEPDEDDVEVFPADDVDEDACPLVEVAEVREAFTQVVRDADGDDEGCSFLLEDGSRLQIEQVVDSDDLDDLDLAEFVSQRASALTTAGDDVTEVEVGDGGFFLRGEAYAEVAGDDALWSVEVVGGSPTPVALRERSDGVLAVAVEAFDD